MGTDTEKGLSLLELVVAIAIIGVLSSLATVSYQSMRKNANIDRQARELYADLMKARSDALFQKSPRSVKLLSATELAIYPNGSGTGTPILRKTFSDRHPMLSSDTDTLVFDAIGVTDVTKAYCVGPAGNSAGVDSVVVSTTSIMLGKLSGGACTSANIVAR